MKIAVLIATRNRPHLLALCIAALLRNTRLPDEIVIIDQSDDSASQTVIEKSQPKSTAIRYEKTSTIGKSRALNRAVQITTADFLAFTDDDVQVDERWLETAASLASEHPDAGAFCGKVLPEQGTDPKDYLNLVLGNEKKRIGHGTNPLNSSFCGANMLVRRETLLRIGGFHESFGPGSIFTCNDDGELAWRLVRAGVIVWYCPDLVVYHSGWRREADNRALKSRYAFGLGALAGHYMRQGDPVPFYYLVIKSILKFRRLILGVIIFQKERIVDGYLHLDGFLRGFFKGLLTPGKPPSP